MAIIRMSSEEIEQKYPITPERLAKINAMKDEDIDLSDIPEITAEEMKNAIRPGLMTEEELKKLREEKPQWSPIVRNELLRRAGRKQKVQKEIISKEGKLSRELQKNIIESLVKAHEAKERTQYKFVQLSRMKHPTLARIKTKKFIPQIFASQEYTFLKISKNKLTLTDDFVMREKIISW
jgi:hypothetical protein